MLKKFFNNVFEQKFYLMCITSVIYILGLIGFFNGNADIVLGLLVLIFSGFILKKWIVPRLAIFFIFVYLFAFFNAFLRIHNFDDLTVLAPNNAVIEGQVVTIPDLGLETRTRFFFDVETVSVDGRIIPVHSKTFVNIYGKHEEINIGDYYEISGKLRLPSKVSNPSQFDYAKYLRNFDVFTTFFAESCTEIGSPKSLKWKFLQGLNNKRKEILSYHAENIKSPNLEILGGVVFGDDAVSPPDNIKKSFINSGILHILAASGMNVALIYGIFFFLLSSLKVPPKINIILGIAIISIYTLMTGMGASVIRAAVILIFILIGKLMNRDAHSLSLLAFVALLMLIVNPAYINDVGFQLSFIVTLGLLLMTKPVFKITQRLPDWLSSAIFIPVIAQIWVAPIQMFYFNTFSLYSVFANILILPFITIISFGGFISSVLAMIKPAAPFICKVFDFVLNPVISGLVYVSDYFSNLSHSLVTMPKPHNIQMILYYLVLIILTVILTKGFKKKFVGILAVLIFGFILTFVKFDKTSELIVFDVQNADCMLYKTNEGKYFVIDTGKLGYNGAKNQVNYIMAEYLKDEGIKNIEGLILTHFDADHAGGAVDLIKNFNVKKVYVNSLHDKSAVAQSIYSLKPHLVLAKNNQTIYEENGLFIKTYIGNFTDEKLENENSIITYINDNNYKTLLMGDAGIVAFNKLKNDLPANIDVLKVGHHGAKNVANAQMIEYLSPTYSIISTGYNVYGHPVQSTLDVLSSTKILRTDRNNALKLTEKAVFAFDKSRGWVLKN